MKRYLGDDFYCQVLEVMVYSHRTAGDPKFMRHTILLVFLLFGASTLHAQLQLSSEDLSAIESTSPLTLDEMPVLGTFYSAANPLLPPLPGNILGLSGWNLGGGYYLLDDLDGSSGGGFHAMDDSGPFPPGAGEGGSVPTNSIPPFSFPTNGLWLWITNVANNTVYANLNGATDCVYEIYSKTDLMATNWDIETEVFPCDNTNTMPFTVDQNGRANLFLWARDWTGITSNGNTTPDSWFYYWFGSLDWSDTNLDIYGNSFLTDFDNYDDPNHIAFSLQFTNTYSTANPMGATINLEYGLPFYEAILINDTNADDLVWKPFTSTNLSLSLSNGLCSVYVGLRGRQPGSWQSWQLAQLTLNTTPLTLTVTNPFTNVVSQPMIQLQGYGSKPLASLTYDVSNATGIFTNQTGYIISQYCDTNLQAVTTNYFQCYDISLITNGLNVVTLHATDTAGETASTSKSFTLDYSANTNPPVLSILWPPDGTSIGGTNFILQAQVDDDTATVTAQISDASENVSTVKGLVTRSGVVWANNLPLSAGTNLLTVTATDAGGYSTTTNLTLIESAVAVTVDPLPPDQLNQPSVTVTGTVSDTNETVYVNGTQATVNTDGTWSASGVPVNPTGTATFNIQTYSADSTPDGSQASTQEQPPMIVLADYKSQSGYSEFNNGQNQTIQWDYENGGNFSQTPYSSGGGNGPAGDGAHDPDIPPDGAGFSAPVVTSDQGETFAPTWQISKERMTEGNDNLQTLTETTLKVVGGDQVSMGGTVYWLIELAGNEFSDLMNDENIFNLNLGGANQGDVPDPPEWFQANGEPLMDMGITNDDGTLPGIASVSAPAGTTPNLKLTSTQDYSNNNQTFPQSDALAVNFYLAVVSNSAVQINGTTNWATVQATNNDVIVQAETSTTNAGFLTWLGTNITWSGGTPVPGNPLQCEVSTAVSTNVTVTASVGRMSVSVDVWVIWATVTVTNSGNKTPYDPATDVGDKANFPSYSGGNELGPENQLANTDPYIGWKVEIKGTISPANAYLVITNGWVFYQTLTYIDFINDTNYPTYGTEVPDAVFNSYSSNFEDKTPDVNGNIFAVDGPGYLGAFDTFKLSNNFKKWVLWNGKTASDPTPWWVKIKAESNGGMYNVITNSGGNGTTIIDNFY